MRESLKFRIFIHVAAVLMALIFLAPFAWLLIASLASQADLLSLPLRWVPHHLSFHRYSQIFTSSPWPVSNGCGPSSTGQLKV